MFLEINLLKCLNIKGEKLVFLAKSLDNTYEEVHFQLTWFKNKTFQVFQDFPNFLVTFILSDTYEWFRDCILHLLGNPLSILK